MKSQPGQPELAWHWVDWDFKAYFISHLGDLAQFADKRVSVYKNAPELEERHGGVRVTWKRSLLPPECNDPEPEYKPIGMGDDGNAYTLLEGQLFMKSYPPFHTTPSYE
eukprot:5758594-Pleurochrysis_carterae.AAC.1